MSALTDAKMEEEFKDARWNGKVNEMASKKDWYPWWYHPGYQSFTSSRFSKEQMLRIICNQGYPEHLPEHKTGAQTITWGEAMTRFSDPDYAKLLDEQSGGRKRKAIEMEEMVQSAHADLGDLAEIDFMLPGSPEVEFWYFK